MTSNPFDQFPRVTPENPFDQFPRVAPETPFDQPPAVGPSTRQVLEYAVQTNPDQAARAAQLAKQYQVPADVVQRNLQPVETKAAVDMAFADLQRSPRLTQSMRERPILAQQAHDDIVTLAQVEDFFRNTGSAAKAGAYGASKGAAGVFQAGFEFAAPVLDFLEPVTTIGGNPLRRVAEGFALQAADADAAMKETMPKGEGNIASGYYSGIQSLTQNLISLPLAFFPGGQGAALGMMAGGAGGQAYVDAREQGLPMSQALPYAASQAAIEYVTERTPLLQLLGDVKAGTPLLRTLARQFGPEVVGEQIATALQDLNDWAVLPDNREKTLMDYLAERPDAAAQTLVATLVGTGGNVVVAKGIQAVVDQASRTADEIDSADESAVQLQAALQLASQSRLRERNPEEFRSLVQDMAADAEGSPQEIFIDAEVLNQLAPEVQQQLPESVLAQLGDALAANDVVSIPVADVLTIAPGTPLEQTIVEHGRVGDPMAMTRAEAVQVREQMPELVRAEAERILAQAQAEGVRDESEAVIRDQILGQLNTAGRQRPAVNEAYATLVARAYSTLARRMGMTATELFTERTASVAGTAQPGQDGTVLSQNGIRIRRTIDELVAAAESQADWRTWYQRHEATLVEMFGNDADLFQKLLSATSQATGVKGNVTLALKAYDQLLSGQEFSGYLPAVIKNLERIRDDQALEGAKIAQYGKANEGDTSAIAVDRHIAMLFFNTKTPSKAQIEVAKTRIRKVADRLGWEPRQVQAALWAYNQVRLGTDPTKVESYDKILEARADFIAALRSRHGRGERGSVQAGGGTVQGGQEGPGAGSPDTDDGVLNQRKREPAYYAGGKAWNPGYDYTQLPAEHQAIVDEHIARLDNPEVTKQKLLDYAGTAWAKQAIESAFVRDALERLMMGEQPRAPSWLDNTATPSVVKLREGLLKQGPKYAMAYLERNGLLGNPAKPEEAVAASYLKCEPSKECAESCYAAKNELRPSTLIKAELTDWLIATHPDVAAEITKREWDVSPLKQMGGALRLLDRGDADMKWIPYIDKLTEMGIRTHIFSKHPNVLAAMDPMHLRLLSIDRTSHDLIEQMPEGVGAAYVFAGTEEEIRFIAQHQDRIQVILPIKGTEEFASNADIAALPDSVSKKVCPVDHGYVRIATGYKVVVGKGKEKRVHFFRAKDSGGKLSLKQAREQALALSDGIGVDARMIPLGGYALLDAEGNYLDHFTATEEGLAKAQQLAKSIGGRVEEINGWNCVNCDRKNGLGCYVNHTTTPQPQVHVINIAGLSLRKMQNEAERGIAKIESELGLRLDPDKRQRILDVLVEQLRQDRGGDVRSTEGDSTGQSQTQTAATAGSRQEAAGTGQPGGDEVLNQTATRLPPTILVDGVMRPTATSDGTPIHYTPAGIRNFWRWFGDSKAVDDKGRPLVVFHGTPTGGFTKFDKEKQGSKGGRARGGFSFTTDFDAAESYAKGFDDQVVTLDAMAEAANAILETARPTPDMLALGSADPDEGIRPIDSSVIDTESDMVETLNYYVAQFEVDGQQEAADAMRAVVTVKAPTKRQVYEVFLRVPPDAPEFNATRETLGKVVADLDVRNVKGRAAVVNFPDGSKVFYVADSEQVKSATENTGDFNPADANILMQSDRAPKLMAVHNLTADNLIFSDRMGGLAVPSVGVVTDQAGAVDGFGEITLIGTKGLVDPKRTPVFSADAYTARFPAAEWSKVKSKDAQKVVDSIREAAKEFGDQSVTGETWDNMVNNPDAAKVVEVWLRSSAVRALFLREQGMDVQPVRRNIPSQTPIPVDRLPELKPLFDAIDINQGGDVLDSPEWAALAAAYRQIVLETYRAKGRPDRIAENLGTFDYRAYTNLERDFKNAGKDEVDIWETAKVLGEETDKRAVEFKKWVESKVMPPFGEPFIKVRGKKAPYTLDNIVAVMTDDKIRGKEKTMTYSAGQARAASSIQFSDVEQMREAAQRSVLDKDPYEAARAETEKKLDAFRTAVVEFTTIRNWKGDPDTWEALDASMRALAKFSTGKARGAAALRKALKAEEFDAAKIPDKVIEQGLDAALSLLSAPVPYFEAKPQRAVSLNEFAGAAIPQNAPQEVRDILAKHGVEVVEYADGERVQVAREFAADLSGRGRDTLFQERLGTFNPKSLQIVLNENANLSTFLHESGHLFLELLADLGTRPNAPADVRADLDAVMKWFGVKDAATWQGMTLNQKRMHHERFAESFEQYLLEGKAPSADLQPLFRKFSAWLRSVYRSLKAFIANTPDNGMVLNDDIRQVFDRMLASEEEIHKAEEIAGMVPDEYATEVAIEKLTARSVRDLKWTIGARNRTIKELQRKARTLRNQEMIIARREIMTRPVYRAWAFLTGRMTEEDALPENKIRKSDPRWIDETQDSLFQAIAKLGGIDREQLISQWGMDVKEKARAVTGFGGKRSVDSPNGMPIDQMGLTLVQYGYLSVDENGRYDQQEFEEKFFDGLQGFDHYSLNFDYDTAEAADPKNRGRNLTEFNSGRLDRALLAGFDKAAVTRLEELGMVRNDGLHPDVVADIFGFASGEELVAALAAAEKPQAAIDGLTDQFMLEEHGDLVDQRAIEQAANEAIHNEVRARFLATELKGQADLLNERRDTGKTTAQGRKVTVSVIAEAAKQFAANVVGRTAIRDLKSRAWQHTAAERRAGKRWQEATAAGKTEEAVQAKRDQVLNNAAAKAALDAQARVKQITTFFRQVVKGSNEKMVEKGLDPDLINAARAILGAYGVAPKAAKSAAEYLKVMQANDPVAFAAMQPTIQAALDAAQPLEALTLDELEALHEEIQALWYKARRDRQIRVQGKLIAMEDAEDQLQARMQELGVPDSMPGDTQALTKMDKAKRKLQYARALLRRVEQWAEAMDGKFGGPFTRLVFNPVKQAADDYRADRVKYGKKYQALVDAVAPFMPKGVIAAPELNYTFGKGHNGIGMAELLHAILHTGNTSNKRKLLLGRKWGVEWPDGRLDTSRWDAFLERLTAEGVLRKEHYDFAQGVWDLLEETKPLAQKTHRDVFGRFFEEVTAEAFDTPFGSYRGGYVPAQADPELVQDADLRKLAEAENENMVFAFPATNRGFTKGRVEYNRPLMLDLRTIGQHIDKVLLFSHMEPAVRDVNRLLSRKGVAYSLGRIDPTVYAGMLTPWLSRSARQVVETPVTGDGGISRITSALRARAGMALMFANISNTLQQITGFSLAAVKVKPSLLMKATAQFVKSPRELSANVSTASTFMAHRMENEVSAMNDAINQIVLDQGLFEKSQAWTRRHAYFLQTAMANTMEPIIWTAAYNQGIEQNMDPDEAVGFADNVIRTTQGSTLPEDVSRMETGPAYARIFTQFVGYFNMMANTNGTVLQQVAQELGVKKGAGKMLYVVALGLLVPLWVAEAIAIAMRGGPGDEDDDGYLDDWIAAVFGVGTIKGSLAMVPFVGQLANAAINRTNSNPADDRISLSPAVSFLEAGAGAVALPYKALTDPDSINARNAVRDVSSLLSLVTGLPFYAAARPLGYAAGVADDRIEPTGPVDAVRGLVTGSASPESK